MYWFEIISALLITGYRYYDAEVWAPGEDGAAPLQCELKSMKMKRDRQFHTLSLGSGAVPFACGGTGVEDSKTCEWWTGSGWQKLSTRLSVNRTFHSAWRDPTTGTTYLMGGLYGATTSIDTISTSGSVGRPSWTLKYDTRSVSY